jgi:plastocyanin
MATAGDLLKRVPALLALFSIYAAAQQTVTVNMAEYKYTPAEVRIKAGDTVKWVNNERRTSHSVLFPAENGLESTRMFPGESWERRFQAPGRYEYTCGPHPEMKGVVHVDQ